MTMKLDTGIDEIEDKQTEKVANTVPARPAQKKSPGRFLCFQACGDDSTFALARRWPISPSGV
jgi:hypothetical protein